MKLVRLGEVGAETAGVLVDEDTFVDLSDVVGDFDEAFFGSGKLATLAPLVAERVAERKTEPIARRRFGAPFARPHQILYIGLQIGSASCRAAESEASSALA